MSTFDTILRVLDTHGKLTGPASALTVDDDLHAAGMSSHAGVNVMLALEDALDIEFPDGMLSKSTFASIASIRAAVDEMVNA